VHSEIRDLWNKLVSPLLIYLFLYYNISILRLFLASRGSYHSKLIKESAKPLRTQQMHVHDQRAKDAQAIAQSSKLKTPIIVPSFKQKRL
jgi:hypothetical protein